MAEPAGSAPARDGAASCPACVGPGAQIVRPAGASPRPWRLLRRTGAPVRVRRWRTRRKIEIRGPGPDELHVVPAFSCDPPARFFQHICAEIDAEQTSGRADPLLYQSEVEPGAAADLHDGRAAPQLQRCNGATPVRPPPEADQVIGIHRPVVEARPAAVDFVDLLRRREVAPAQGWISHRALGRGLATRYR